VLGGREYKTHLKIRLKFRLYVSNRKKGRGAIKPSFSKEQEQGSGAAGAVLKKSKGVGKEKQGQG